MSGSSSKPEFSLPVMGVVVPARAADGESLAEEILKADLKKAARARKAERKQQVLQQIKEKPRPLPDGKYDVIVADPPWQYDTCVESAGTVRGMVEYPTMGLGALALLPVRALGADPSVLWLWTTNSFFKDAWDLCALWGYEPKTVLTWDKVNHGVGFYLQNVTEHCILATRGHPVIDVAGTWEAHKRGVCPAPVTLLRAPRSEHSKKPEEFYRLVEHLTPCGAYCRIELFCRTRREDWEAWGAETEKYEERHA